MVWLALGVAVVALAVAVAAYRRAIGADDTARRIGRLAHSWGRRRALLLNRDAPPRRRRATFDTSVGRIGAARIGLGEHEAPNGWRGQRRSRP